MAEPCLAFVGGVSGTRKTAIIDRACDGYPYTAIRISEHYLRAIGQPNADANDLRALEWKKFEPDAIDFLCRFIAPLLETETEAIIINVHFASRSLRGFMSGTDPEGLRTVCETMRMFVEGSETRAGVILLDSSPHVVLAESGRQLPTLNAQRDLEDDLNNNRLLSKDYYHSLVGFLGEERARYASVLVGDDRGLTAEDVYNGAMTLRGHIDGLVHLRGR